MAQEVLKDIADEEKVHAGEFLGLLKVGRWMYYRRTMEKIATALIDLDQS